MKEQATRTYTFVKALYFVGMTPFVRAGKNNPDILMCKFFAVKVPLSCTTLERWTWKNNMISLCALVPYLPRLASCCNPVTTGLGNGADVKRAPEVKEILL